MQVVVGGHRSLGHHRHIEFDDGRRCLKRHFRRGQRHCLHGRRSRFAGQYGSQRILTAQGTGPVNQGTRVGHGTGVVGQMGHPCRKQTVLGIHQSDQIGRDGVFLAQPEVVSLLKLPGRLTQVFQADHAARALEGMGGTPDDGQRILSAGRFVQCIARRREGIEDFTRFGEEDVEQLGIDFSMAGLSQLQHFRRGGRCLGRHRGQTAHRGIDFTGLQGRQRRLGRIAQGAVGHQIGVFLDGLQIVAQRGLQIGIVRRRRQGLRHGLSIPRLTGQLVLDALGGHLGFRHVSGVDRRRAGDPAGKGLEIALAARQGLHEEADQGEFARQLLEIGGIRHIVRLGKMLDLLTAGLEALHRREVSQHGECARHLAQGGIQCRQVGPTGRVAEKGIERLFDLGQIVLDFPGHLTNEQLFLGPAHHLVQPRHALFFRQTAGNAGIQTGDHDVDLAGEIGTELAEMRLGILQQQNGRRHFHADAFAQPARLFCQPAAHRSQALPQALEIGQADLLGQARDRARQFGKGRHAAGTPGTDFGPEFLGLHQDFAQTMQGRTLRRTPFAGAGRQQGIQAVRRLHFGHQRAILCGRAGHVIKHFAHQALGKTATAFEQAPDLGIDPGDQRTHMRIGAQRRIAHRFQECGGSPPESLGGRQGLGLLDLDQGILHGLPGAIRCLRLLQPAEQAFLKTHAGLLEALRQLRRIGNGGHLAACRPQAEIGVKQIAGLGIGPAAHPGQGEIGIGQT